MNDKVKYLIIVLLTFGSIKSFSQGLEDGVYIGQKLPFTICYFTQMDSIIEIEFFFKKASQIFGHIPPKKLVVGTESYKSKPIFKTTDDSIRVFIKKGHYLIKTTRHGRIEMIRNSETLSEIMTMRNRHSLFRFGQDLYNEMKESPGFDSVNFWKEYHSYDIENDLNLSKIEFMKRIEEIKKEIKTGYNNR